MNAVIACHHPDHYGQFGSLRIKGIMTTGTGKKKIQKLNTSGLVSNCHCIILVTKMEINEILKNNCYPSSVAQ